MKTDQIQGISNIPWEKQINIAKDLIVVLRLSSIIVRKLTIFLNLKITSFAYPIIIILWDLTNINASYHNCIYLLGGISKSSLCMIYP